MVGGSSRIPLIHSMLKERFEVAIFDDLNPDEVVALGAAVMGDLLAGNQKEILLLDVTPLSLGIETIGGLMDVIVPRNSKIPSAFGRNYTTSIDGQINLKISVFQGERDLVQNNRKLGEFILKKIPSMPAGIPKIEVLFHVNSDGMLKVTGKELRSGIEQQVEITSQYGISEEEMALLLIDSIKNAQQDKDQKALLEAINEANNIILATEKFIRNNSIILNENDVANIIEKKDKIFEAIKIQDKNKIYESIQELDDLAKPLAEMGLDLTLKEALKGKNVDQIL